MTRVGVIVGNRYYTSEQLNRRMVYLRVRRDYIEAFRKNLKRDLKRRVNAAITDAMVGAGLGWKFGGIHGAITGAVAGAVGGFIIPNAIPFLR